MSTNAQRFPTSASAHEVSHFRSSHHFRHQHKHGVHGYQEGNVIHYPRDYENVNNNRQTQHKNVTETPPDLMYYQGPKNYENIIVNSKKRVSISRSEEALPDPPVTPPSNAHLESCQSNNVDTHLKELTEAILKLSAVAKEFLEANRQASPKV